MRKLFAGLLAVGVIAVGGASYALVAPTAATAQDTATGDTATEEPNQTTTTVAGDPGAADDKKWGAPKGLLGDDVLDEVLDGLVADDTLTRAQADEVAAAIAARLETLRSELGDRPGRGGGAGHGRGFPGGGFPGGGFLRNLEDLLDDDVIDADELVDLGDNHPLVAEDSPLADAIEEGGYLDDGRLTRDELSDLHDTLHADRPFPVRPGAGGDVEGPTDDSEEG